MPTSLAALLAALLATANAGRNGGIGLTLAHLLAAIAASRETGGAWIFGSKTTSSKVASFVIVVAGDVVFVVASDVRRRDAVASFQGATGAPESPAMVTAEESPDIGSKGKSVRTFTPTPALVAWASSRGVSIPLAALASVAA